jgi:hypothetical protein
MAKLFTTLVSFFKMLAYGIIPKANDNAWDSYRKARLATLPVTTQPRLPKQ